MRTLIFSLLMLALASARAETPEQALARFVDGVQTLQADFVQTQTDEQGETLSSSQGAMALVRPGKFRWEYQTPTPQLIVTDGSKLWLYDRDLQQVSIRPAAEALQGTPAALLSQQQTLTETFQVADAGVDGPVRKLRLTPKAKDGDFQSVDLWLRAGTPVRMLFRDQLGGATDIAFSNIRTNGRVEAAQFRFQPPKGVEVIDSTSAP
ncbi:MAG: outer membrane lipoprotein chaperone LolA [Stagnimonas sp.]|nr:outer membrane lipoprotein chaperone LolA [Stagnimonas sp.]